MLASVNQIRRELYRLGSIFSISGPISQEIIVQIGDILKKRLEHEEVGTTTILRVFAIVVELAQNVIRYSAEKYVIADHQRDSTELGVGMIIVGIENGHYYIFCGNQVENKNIACLSDKLKKIKNMDKDELKKYYKEQRNKESDHTSRGAGLGLIEIARKIKNPIEFEVNQVNDDRSFFSVKVTV